MEAAGWVEAALELLAGAVRSSTDSSPRRALSPAELAVLEQRQIDSLHHLAQVCTPAAQRLYDKRWAAQRRALDELLGALADEGVAPILFKGAELVARRYRDRAIGLLYDVDLLVRREELGTAERVLYRLGYAHGAYDPTTRRWLDGDALQIARIELTHYELFPFLRLEPLALDDEERAVAARYSGPPHRLFHVTDDHVFTVLGVDVHHALRDGLDSAPLFERAGASAFAGARTLGAADHLVFLARRYYVEVAQWGKLSLRPFVYLAPFLSARDVDWDLVRRLAVEQGARAPIYYWLGFLDRLGGGVLPSALLEGFSPCTGKRENDFGWQLAQLFDAVDPYPLAARR